jgi:hypothetical protein
MTDWTQSTAIEISTSIGRREVSALEVTREILDRVDPGRVHLRRIARWHSSWRDDRAVEAGAAYAAYAPALFRRPEVDPAQAKPIPDRLPSPGMVMR